MANQYKNIPGTIAMEVKLQDANGKYLWETVENAALDKVNSMWKEEEQKQKGRLTAPVVIDEVKNPFGIYSKDQIAVIDLIKENMIKGALVSAQSNIFVSLVQNISAKTIAGSEANIDALYSPRSRGRRIGLWIERSWFGLPENPKSTYDLFDENTGLGADIKSYLTQTKGKTQEVGSITVSDLPSTVVPDDVYKLLIAYKMLTKMQNFLNIKVSARRTITLEASKVKKIGNVAPPERKKGWTMETAFEEVMLHMELNLKKLRAILDKQEAFGKRPGGKSEHIIRNEWFFIDGLDKEAQPYKEGETIKYKKTISISLNRDLIASQIQKNKQVKRFVELYIYHEDFLKDIHGDNDFRKMFFGNLDRVMEQAEYIYEDDGNPEEIS